MLSRPLLASGFRPFFLLGTLWAAIVGPVWVLVVRGAVTPALPAVTWHVHEMLVGVGGAIIAGFLLTAVRHWTGGQPTLAGGGLLALAALWLLGRVAMFPGAPVPHVAAIIVNLLFLPALAWAVARPILRTRNMRNVKVLFLLVGMTLAQAGLLLLPFDGGASVRAGRMVLLCVVVLCMVITGRIVPLFTGNALKRSGLRTWTPAEWPAFGGVLVVMICVAVGADAWGAGGGVGRVCCAVAAAVASLGLALRMRHWGTLASRGDPMLWVLHLGHGWFVVGFALLALGGLIDRPHLPSAAVHALGLGGVGTLIVGMVVRVSLGHTGREIAASRWAVTAFVAVTVGAVARTFGPVAVPAAYLRFIDVAGLAWSLAFALVFLSHAQMLVRARPDGRPG